MGEAPAEPDGPELKGTAQAAQPGAAAEQPETPVPGDSGTMGEAQATPSGARLAPEGEPQVAQSEIDRS